MKDKITQVELTQLLLAMSREESAKHALDAASHALDAARLRIFLRYGLSEQDSIGSNGTILRKAEPTDSALEPEVKA